VNTERRVSNENKTNKKKDEYSDRLYCGVCGEKVHYPYGLGTYTHGASESYENWDIKHHKFCPKCGTEVDYN
jgi:ribosomal protein S27AE